MELNRLKAVFLSSESGRLQSKRCTKYNSWQVEMDKLSSVRGSFRGVGPKNNIYNGRKYWASLYETFFSHFFLCFLALFVLTGILKQHWIKWNYSLHELISKLESEWASCHARFHMTALYLSILSAVSAVLRTTLQHSPTTWPEMSPTLLCNESLQSRCDLRTV